MFQDILVTGLVNGGVYALLAIGFSLIFGVARIVNIAHTAFYMLAAYCFYALMVKVGLGFVVSALVAVGAVTALSVICYRLVIEPVREHEAAVAGVVVAPVFVVEPFMWLAPLVTMLAVVVLGGLGSLKGSLVGALIIGYVEAITVFVLPAGAYLKGAVALLIMVAVLLARPEGLFGVAFEEER